MAVTAGWQPSAAQVNSVIEASRQTSTDAIAIGSALVRHSASSCRVAGRSAQVAQLPHCPPSTRRGQLAVTPPIATAFAQLHWLPAASVKSVWHSEVQVVLPHVMSQKPAYSQLGQKFASQVREPPAMYDSQSALASRSWQGDGGGGGGAAAHEAQHVSGYPAVASVAHAWL